nr:hypothetical protein [Pseudomonas aeruginosa]
MKTEVFHTATIGRIVFSGWVSFNGPRISSNEGGSVNLGPCCIRHFAPDIDRPGIAQYTKGWYIVKYTSEVKIPLPGFTEVNALQLSTEFGIPMRRDRPDQPHDRVDFYASQAFEGLKLWVRNHPRKAKQITKNNQDYLPGWYERAIS